MPRAVVVGAGPAGITAAQILVEGGVEVVLLDEARRPGGQGYRASPPSLALPERVRRLGDEAGWRRIHGRFAALGDRVDHRPRTLAWNVADGVVQTSCDGVLDEVAFDALLLCTGATDRIMPVPGWTLPGVYTLGAAQIALKDQGCAIGREDVFCGASPLLYLAALQYVEAGARVVAVLDTTPFSEKLRALPELAAAPRQLMRGIGLIAALKRHGVAIQHGVRLKAFTGDEGGVDGVAYADAQGRDVRLGCDAVAFGFGLRPESQLAEIAGCEMRYDAAFRQWFPAHDGTGRCRKGLYVAGDGCRVGGALAAEAAGLVAAQAALADLGLPPPADDVAARRTLAAMERFQRGLARAFAWPWRWAAELADDTVVCRCENVTAGAIRGAVHMPRGGERDVNRVKAAARCGMGRCQGRFCGNAAAELVAATLGDPRAEPGRLRAQPPVKPLPIAAAAQETVA